MRAVYEDNRDSDAGTRLLALDVESVMVYITPAVKYPTVVIPAEAGIQKDTGCRIQSGMTDLAI